MACENVMKIPLPHGQFVLVDAQNFEWLNKRKWHTSGNPNYLYALRNGRVGERPSKISMHREIMCPLDGFYIDHRNGDGLDNRKCNLRIVTHAENMMNRKPSKSLTGKYKGIYPHQGKWRAEIKRNGKKYYLGVHETEEQAAKAYNRGALIHHGEFAYLNPV